MIWIVAYEKASIFFYVNKKSATYEEQYEGESNTPSVLGGDSDPWMMGTDPVYWDGELFIVISESSRREKDRPIIYKYTV